MELQYKLLLLSLPSLKNYHCIGNILPFADSPLNVPNKRGAGIASTDWQTDQQTAFIIGPAFPFNTYFAGKLQELRLSHRVVLA